MIIRNFKIILAFLITTTIMSAINLVAQIILIFLDLVESSSALILVLWIITGVFAAIFTEGVVTLFIDKKEIDYRVELMFQGQFIHDISEFTLLLSNGFVFISYFFGSAIMSFIASKL